MESDGVLVGTEDDEADHPHSKERQEFVASLQGLSRPEVCSDRPVALRASLSRVRSLSAEFLLLISGRCATKWGRPCTLQSRPPTQHWRVNSPACFSKPQRYYLAIFVLVACKNRPHKMLDVA